MSASSGLGGRGNDHINFYGKLDAESRIAGLCDVNQAARERAVAPVIKRERQYEPKEYCRHARDVRFQGHRCRIHHDTEPLARAGGDLGLQAGKDVYVEKPASHNMYESQQMVKAARKYNRMVQVGSQSRSMPKKIKAMQLLRDGVIGNGVSCARRMLPPALLDRPHAG